MAETSRPWQSTSPGDAGPYNASNWQQLYRSALGLAASRANVGVLLGSGVQPNDPLRVQAKGVPTTSIDVLAGSALVQGVLYISTATVSFVIAANSSGNPRIDTVILRADYALQTVRLMVLQGTPAASPSAPALTQSTNVMWDIPLADIAVANAFVSITNANITRRAEPANAADGVYLDTVLNNSGGTLEDGDVVIWDSTADRAVTTTTTTDNILLAGVWVGRTANGGYGRVLVEGIKYVNGGAAITRGSILVNSGTAKQAIATTFNSLGARLGRALETTSGAGPVLTYVDVQMRGNFAVLVQDQKASGTAPASLTAGAWRTCELTVIANDPASIASLVANQITLPAGDYLAWCSMPSTVNATLHAARLRLRNVSDGVTLFQGSNATMQTSASLLTAFGYFRLTASKLIELQQFPTLTGLAAAAVTTGESEIYGSVLFQRIG